MSELNKLVWMAPLLPMLAAAWIAMATIARLNLGEKGEKQTSQLISLASGGALLLLMLLDVLALINGVPGTIQVANWLRISYRSGIHVGWFWPGCGHPGCVDRFSQYSVLHQLPAQGRRVPTLFYAAGPVQWRHAADRYGS